MVQWLGLHTSTAGGAGLIPGRGTNIPHATLHSQKKKTKQNKTKTQNKKLLELRETLVENIEAKRPQTLQPTSRGNVQVWSPKHTHQAAHSCHVCNSPKLETTQRPLDPRMDQ